MNTTEDIDKNFKEPEKDDIIDVNGEIEKTENLKIEIDFTDENKQEVHNQEDKVLLQNKIKARDLLNYNRIDTIIGFEYVDYYENKYQTNFYKELHLNHKHAFNGLREKEFKGEKDFLDRFNNLIEGIKKEGTNTEPIPIIQYNNENWVLDGFHRTSILAYYNLPGKFDIMVVPNEEEMKKVWYYPTTISLFQKRGFTALYRHYTMMCYFKKHFREFSCILLFPSPNKLREDLYDQIKDDILYELKIPAEYRSHNFNDNFIQLIYYYEFWCLQGGYKFKSKACFCEEGDLKILFTRKKSLEFWKEYKKEVREFYGKSNHSIHIPDTQEECFTLVELLNKNTIHFLNQNKTLYIKFLNFNRLLNELRNFCKENNIDKDKICITSSAVLSVYGIRDCADLDLLIDKKYEQVFTNSIFENHNIYALNQHYGLHFDDIIYNPKNHFYFQGFKFVNLEIILKYKELRVENKLFGENSIKKDINDILSIINLCKDFYFRSK